MAQATAPKKGKLGTRLLPRARPVEAPEAEATSENVVVFTSHDGTVREVGDLPSNLGRATALANEKSVSKVWGTPEEEAACHAMREGI